MRSDEELKKTFKVFLDENNIINIIYIEAVLDSEENVRHSKLVKEEVLKIIKENRQNCYKIIIDNSLIGNKGIAPVKSRRIYLNLFSNEKIKGAAVIGGNMIVKTVSNLLTGIVFGSKKVKWFLNRENAIRWLKNL